MRKSILLTVIFFSIILFCNAQGRPPGMKWSKLWGAESADELTGADRINFVDRDGQYLLGLTSNSTTGYFSGNHIPANTFPSSDIWVAKLDTQRNILWHVSLGGTKGEGIGSLQLAHDSGYIVAGGASSNDGDVTGHHGNGDVWVVRLGSNGNIIWQKCYGGSLNDYGIYVERTPDGYILLGSTASNDGDVSGSHGTTYDIWVAKLDKNGNMLWQKCLGGSNDEHPSAIKQTTDGGYIITGSSNSWDGDVLGSHSQPDTLWIKPDAWVVKLDRNGSIEWQKCLGGTSEDSGADIEITPAGDYIISCSTSSTDGDVTGLHTPDASGSGTGDAWIVNLSATGVIKWQKCFGGSRGDNINDIQILPNKLLWVLVAQAHWMEMYRSQRETETAIAG